MLPRGKISHILTPTTEQTRTFEQSKPKPSHNPDTAHIPIHYDPGHIKKNFQKSLMAIYGASVRYKGLAERGGQ